MEALSEFRFLLFLTPLSFSWRRLLNVSFFWLNTYICGGLKVNYESFPQMDDVLIRGCHNRMAASTAWLHQNEPNCIVFSRHIWVFYQSLFLSFLVYWASTRIQTSQGAGSKTPIRHGLCPQGAYWIVGEQMSKGVNMVHCGEFCDGDTGSLIFQHLLQLHHLRRKQTYIILSCSLVFAGVCFSPWNEIIFQDFLDKFSSFLKFMLCYQSFS